MALFNRSYTTYYWSATVSIALSSLIFEYLTLNNTPTFKSGLEITQGHWKGTTQKPWYGSSVSHSCSTVAVSCMISEIKWNTGWKLQFFIPLPAFDTLITWVPIGILPYRLVGKTRMVLLPKGEKSLRICLAISTEYRHVTDSQSESDRHLVMA